VSAIWKQVYSHGHFAQWIIRQARNFLTDLTPTIIRDFRLDSG
jgi:hypothetical protein